MFHRLCETTRAQGRLTIGIEPAELANLAFAANCLPPEVDTKPAVLATAKKQSFQTEETKN